MNRTITVKGAGKLSLTADFTAVNITVKSSDKDYAAAMDKAAEQLEDLREKLVAGGLSKDDIKTTDFNVQTQYDNEKDEKGGYKRVFAGFVVSHNLKAEFAFDKERLAKVLSALSATKGQPEFSVRFTVKDKEAAKQSLIKAAVKDAKEKAAALAEAADVRLGQIVNIDYNVGNVNFYSPARYQVNDAVCRSAAFTAAHIDIAPEDIELSDTVTVVWEIE